MTMHTHIINEFNSVHEYSAWDAANALQLHNESFFTTPSVAPSSKSLASLMNTC